MTNDQLLAALYRRMIADSQGDSGPLLADAAADQARRLRAATWPQGGLPANVGHLLATFYRLRASARGGGLSADLTTALELYAGLVAFDPRLVPRDFLEALARHAGRPVPPVNGSGDAFAMSNEATALLTGDPDWAAVTRAVDLLQEAVRIAPDGHYKLCLLWTNLSAALERQYRVDRNAEALDQAIGAATMAVRYGALGYPGRATALVNLGQALRFRSALPGHGGDLEQAVTVLSEAERAYAEGDPELPDLLGNLSGVLLRRYEHGGPVDDLDRAIEVVHRQISLTASDPEGRADARANLALYLRLRFERLGRVDDLAGAVEAGRSATEPGVPGSARRSLHLSHYGTALTARFEHGSDRTDLDEAVRVLQSAVAAPGENGRAEALGNLGGAFGRRYVVAGDPADLGQAVLNLRAAVKTTAQDDPAYPGFLTGLSTALKTRYWLQSELADLNDAVRYAREAVDQTPARHRDRAMYLLNLSSALSVQAGRDPTGDALDEAVTAAEQAVAETEAGHILAASARSTLATALYTRFERDGAEADLDKAIDLMRGTVESSDIERGRHAGNLAGMLSVRHRRTGSRPDLDAAVAEGQKGLRLLPERHPDRGIVANNLGRVLLTRYEREHAEEDLVAALDRWAEAAANELAAPYVRVQTARDLADEAMRHDKPDRAIAGYTTALMLLPRLTWLGLSRRSSERALRNWPGLAVDAAAAVLAGGGSATTALGLLESGRALIWQRALEISADLTDLRRVRPDLADRVESLRALLRSPTGTEFGVAGPDDRVDQRMALAAEWESLMKQIGAVPGFETTLDPPSAADLLQAAAGGPVVVVNVSQWRCDALILNPAAQAISALPLTRLTAADVYQRTVDYMRALAMVEDTDREYRAAVEAFSEGDRSPACHRRNRTARRALLEAQQELADQLTAITAWLWDDIAEPVLRALPEPAAGDGPRRIWWCPTGLLSVLPLHAAGEHTPDGIARRRTLLDRTVSSYTPTLRALAEARRPPAGPEAGGRLLLVAVPDVAGQPPLPNVARERDVLTGRFGGAVTLLDDRATVREVESALRQHRWAHFSCHANQSYDDPSQGGLRLVDGTLTVERIGAGERHGEFAFLSACKTAFGGLTLPDEAITLAAALHYTGYRYIIATQWSVYDSTAAEVTEMVYAELCRSGSFTPKDSAAALHHALRALRDGGRTPLSAWTPFTHTGL